MRCLIPFFFLSFLLLPCMQRVSVHRLSAVNELRPFMVIRHVLIDYAGVKNKKKERKKKTNKKEKSFIWQLTVRVAYRSPNRLHEKILIFLSTFFLSFLVKWWIIGDITSKYMPCTIFLSVSLEVKEFVNFSALTTNYNSSLYYILIKLITLGGKEKLKFK